MADKKSLYQQAVKAGLNPPDYDDITGKELEALLEGVDDKAPDEETDDSTTEEAQQAVDGLRVNNLRDNPVSVRGVQIAPKGFTVLSEREAADERLMAKIQHGVATGVYSIG